MSNKHRIGNPMAGRSVAQHRRLSVELLGIDFLGDYS